MLLGPVRGVQTASRDHQRFCGLQSVSTDTNHIKCKVLLKCTYRVYVSVDYILLVLCQTSLHQLLEYLVVS